MATIYIAYMHMRINEECDCLQQFAAMSFRSLTQEFPAHFTYTLYIYIYAGKK